MLTIKILWHAYPLLDNNRAISSYTTAVTEYWPCKQVFFALKQLETATAEWCFLWGPCHGVISRTVSESQFPVWRLVQTPPLYPVSHRMQQKGNPAPGVLTGPPCSLGI
jgi:hypothetical protein